MPDDKPTLKDDYHPHTPTIKPYLGKGWPDGIGKVRHPKSRIQSNAAIGFGYLFSGRRCVYCLKAIPSCDVTIDHIVPRGVGGTNDAVNQAPSCGDCNNEKSNRILGATELRFFFGEARTLALLEEMKRCGIEVKT